MSSYYLNSHVVIILKMLPICAARRDGAAPCEKTISVGVFEQGLHAEVHGAQLHQCAFNAELQYIYLSSTVINL
jgi:hypothetical protein